MGRCELRRAALPALLAPFNHSKAQATLLLACAG